MEKMALEERSQGDEKAPDGDYIFIILDSCS